ncbi:chondroadherin [Engraulis encrasicolus]|uniref:chondroadherin n=1 Tax=Engraulis encrasicolus TaxID=184585 RepID=UPI002FD68C91
MLCPRSSSSVVATMAFLLVALHAVTAVPGAVQCPTPCHCHGDLQHVICDNVGLKKIPQVTENTRLLNMQRNQLGALPPSGFVEMKGLISLHLQHCKLQEIAGQAFKGLKKLIYLYLNDNEITTLRPGAFDDLGELTYLYLDGNRISGLAKGIFAPMINLFILQLNNNQIRELPAGVFMGAKDLRWLHLAGNQIDTIQPGSLDDVENLAILHLDRNQLATYPLAPMSKLRVVEELTLSKNPLTFIPDNAFRSFGRYMEQLHLDNMGLQKFADGAFGGVTALRSLYLDNNKLKSLPSSLEFTTLTNLTLSNNPWACTCQLTNLRKWMDMSRQRPDALCSSPSTQRGKQIRDSNVFSRCKGKTKTKRAKKGARH